MTSSTSSNDALAALWRHAGQDAAALDAVALTGTEPVLPSSFAVGTAAQASIAASALAAAEIWRQRGGGRQQVAVDMRDAAIEFRSERYARVDGAPAKELWDTIAGLYSTRDGRFVRLHTNFPHHRDGVLKLLGCDYSREAVQRALAGWDGETFETAAAEAGLVVTMTRSFAAWDASGQGRAVASLPPFTIEQIGAAPPQPLPAGTRPLSGVRVLDLTRVIAGPVCGRTLAAHGADVLHVTGAHLPQMLPLVIDSGRGKLTTFIDLRAPDGRETLAALTREADIFVQGYRPGAVANNGFSPEEAARLRPGLVYVSLCAYGHEGPWAARRGFDSLVQNANGLNDAEAQAAGSAQPKPAQPKPLPCQALDHGAGYFMAFGAMTALRRRMTEGGSWHVRVSLAQAGHWLRGLGRVADGLALADPGLDAVSDRLEDSDSGFGRLTAVRHAAVLSETPTRWERPSMPLGSHPSRWPDRA
jgi:crotonobetainyl-CoA:carnitine CoA-transferase CaiB-like acyl-CoA transferase